MSSSLPWLSEPDPAPAPARGRPATTDGIDHGVWVFLLGDMSLFAIFFSAFVFYRRGAEAAYADASQHLLVAAGLTNTAVLLVSSAIVAAALAATRAGHVERSRGLLAGALLCALAFVAVKAIEYHHAWSAGHTPTSSRFDTFYFVLTGIHLLHVLIGSVFLTLWRRRGAGVSNGFATGSALYWHMVDLLWVVIFALIYLVARA